MSLKALALLPLARLAGQEGEVDVGGRGLLAKHHTLAYMLFECSPAERGRRGVTWRGG